MNRLSVLRTSASELFLCAMLSVTPAFAAGPDAWVPARWPGGPLELQRRAREGTLPETRALRETIRTWYDPATLDLLRGTPINCLLVTWSAGDEPEIEKEQQKLVAGYARAARARGIAVLGVVHGREVTSPIFASAAEAGLDGLVLEGAPAKDTPPSSLVVISAGSREQLAPAAPVFATSDAVPPGVRELSEEAEASPSAEPWIDSNVWLARSIRAWGGIRPTWLLETLAADAARVDYLRAIADAAAGGARWVVALGDEVRHGMRTNQPEATATWREIAAYLEFQQQHAEWARYRPLAVYGFVQDSNGSARDASGEQLNLALRRGIPLRVVERAQLNSAALEGLRAIHAIDVAQPTAQERTLLTGFAEAGGLLIAAPSWQQAEIPEGQDFTVVPAGKGRIAMFREDADPGELARSLVDLLGRDNLRLRLFRAASVLSHASESESGQVLVHLVNYASYPAESVLVRVDGEFRGVRLYTPGHAPETLPLEQSGGRSEVTIARLPVYGVLLFDK